MWRKCKDCKHLEKCKNDEGRFWCSWLGIFRKPSSDECLEGFISKKNEL